MTDIEKTLNILIAAISEDKINCSSVINAWHEYSCLWPDLARAMSYFQKTLLHRIINEEEKDKYLIVFGQYMENFRWAIKKAS